MGAKNIGGGNRKTYPTEVEVGCLNTLAHKGYKIVNFKIPRGHQSASCPECGRRAGKP